MIYYVFIIWKHKHGFLEKHLKRGLKEIKLDTFYSTVKQETSNCNKSAV